MPFSILEQVESHEGALDVQDLMRIFKKGRQTIYDMMNDGRLPELHLGEHKRHSRVVDPKTLAYQLRRQNPMMRDAARS